MVDEGEGVLVERALAGDRRAFGALVESYGRVVYNVAYRMVSDPEDARDLSQIVFIKAYEKLGTFDRRNRFFSWIYRIAINESLNHLARRRRHEELSETIVSAGATPEEQSEANEEERLVQNALTDLRAEDRELILQRHFLRLSHREMSELLHVPEKTVKSRLHTALGRLEGALRRRGYSAS